MLRFAIVFFSLLLAFASPAFAAPSQGGARLGSNIYDGGASGRVGIGTSDPQATLDINGTARLALNSAAPFPCDSSRQGVIALTRTATLCVCDTANRWTDIATRGACAW